MFYDINGDNYSMANGYSTETMINETYGGFCEFTAVGFVISISFGSPSIWFFLPTSLDLLNVQYKKLPGNVS